MLVSPSALAGTLIPAMQVVIILAARNVLKILLFFFIVSFPFVIKFFNTKTPITYCTIDTAVTGVIAYIEFGV